VRQTDLEFDRTNRSFSEKLWINSVTGENGRAKTVGFSNLSVWIVVIEPASSDFVSSPGSLFRFERKRSMP